MMPDRSVARSTDSGSTGLDDPRERFGVCQWFHYQDYDLLESTVEALDDLGVRHLRTGISWADWHRVEGAAWYEWQMDALGQADLEILLSIWHTPPSITLDPERGMASIPPERVEDFADFTEDMIHRHGDTFTHVELWNEPNNPYKWDRTYDPDFSRFGEMIVRAAARVRECGKVPVLGGLTLLDYDFVATMDRHGVLDAVEIVGIHAFPGMWEPHASSWDVPGHWYGWKHRVEEISRAAGDLPVWVTETGLATYDKATGARSREEIQVERLQEALEAPAERVYWYSLFDLPPSRVAIEEANEGPREEPEYHMGLVRHADGFALRGNEKPAYFALKDHFRTAGELAPSLPGGASASAVADTLRTDEAM